MPELAMAIKKLQAANIKKLKENVERTSLIIDAIQDTCDRTTGTLMAGISYTLKPGLLVDPLEAFDVAVRIIEKNKEKLMAALAKIEEQGE